MRSRGSLSCISVQVENESVTIEGQCFSIPNISFIKEISPRGANGLVFEATDEILKRKVAVKIWVPRQADTRDRKKQALAEAAKVARLDHRNIVKVYTCGELKQEHVYSIMEFIGGKTLREFLKVENPDFVERVRIWREIEEALMHAHSRGVYHGDLHDSNVMSAGRTVKVIDFGTSLFALNRNASLLRESMNLFRLCRKMFSEYKPTIRQITDVSVGDLKPELALSALSSWVSILWDWRELLTAKRLTNNQRVVRAIAQVAFDVCLAPVFSVHALVNQLKRDGFSKEVQDYFVAYCVLWTEVRLQKAKEGKKPFSKYHHDIPLDRKANEISLEALWPSLRAHFYDFGPFD